MPWSPPGIPVSGTTITVAFATALINTGLNWLRQLTGGADPTAADQIIRSTSTSTSVWGKATTNVIDDAAITDVKLANQKVNKVNPQYTTFGSAGTGGGTDNGSGFVDIVSTPGDSPVPATLNWMVIQNRHWNHGADYRWQLAVDLANSTQIWSRSVIAGAGSTWHRMFHSGMDGAGSGIDADLLDGVQGSGYALAAAGVPSGMIAGYRTAAAIPAGWTRFTDGDGRFLIGAGVTDGQTFAENTQNTAAWSHLHSGTSLGTAASGGGGAVQSGGASSADPQNHTHGVTGNTGGTVWIPPVRVVVHAIRT